MMEHLPRLAQAAVLMSVLLALIVLAMAATGRRGSR